MTKESIEKEIKDLVIKLNNATKELAEQGNAFIDKKYFDKVFKINRELEEKIRKRDYIN